MTNAKCKICRRLGVKLFLKGERCLSPKCSLVRKPYPPGIKGKRPRRGFSEYGKELREKQKLRNWYNLRERQFRKYIKEVLTKRGTENAEELLIRKLEMRLDNVVYRLGFASSRREARQLVSHRHFLVNGRRVNIPSFALKKGDKVALVPGHREKEKFKKIIPSLKKHDIPSWLKFDYEKLEAEIVSEPKLEEVSPPAEISKIFEFYSK